MVYISIFLEREEYMDRKRTSDYLSSRLFPACKGGGSYIRMEVVSVLTAMETLWFYTFAIYIYLSKLIELYS